MEASVVMVAALPREIAGVVRGAMPDVALRRQGVWLYRVDGAFVVAAGMGAGRVAVAVEAAQAAGKVGSLISVGLAGACRAGVQEGSVLEAQVVVDVRTGERFGTASQVESLSPGVTLATTDVIASVAEKKRLAASYGAAMVDMEAATVARLARAHGLPFRAIKGISDGAAFELNSLSKFEGEQGSFRTVAFAAHTAIRPWQWAKAARLGRNSATALSTLNAVLQDILLKS
jgi:adenosylhomocysteine nucleosidase